jgi:hypothetical protein
MDPKHIKIINNLFCDGEWHGAHEDGKPVVTINGVRQDATPLLKQLGLKLKKSNKYTEEKQHADLEQPQHSGHTEDAGDGVGESEE